MVPLMMQKGYKATGWLGLILGSRLYFRVTPEVLADGARYETAVDDIAQEVRRRAPVWKATDRASQRSVQAAAVAAPSTVLAPLVRGGEVAPARVTPAAGGGVVINTQSTVHDNSSSSQVIHNNHNNTGNSTTIVLM